ncbi:MAG TPA: hypothetical protein PKC72_11220 [Chitinophagaceae bacterium]|nr:hypothetical protein [Chitinophagaceae bacterium]
MRLLIGLFFSLLLSACLVAKHKIPKNNDNITAITYIVKLPLVQGDRQYIDFCDTIPIYYIQNLIIYKLPYTFDSSKMTYHIKTDTISQEHIMTETRYHYFVYKKGNNNGIWYKSIEQLDSNKILAVDSIIKRIGTPTNLQAIIYSLNDSLLESQSLDNGSILIEKYIPKTKLDDSYNDTTLFYYSKRLKPIQFSLSPFLDSLKNKKLYKLRLAYNEAFSETYSITMPKRDIIYEIREMNVDNIDNLKILLLRFKQDEKLLMK